jgi:hypothetical protein
MDEQLFDEADLNYILAAVVDFKVRVMRMEVNVGRDAEVRKEYVRALTAIEGKISRELDGDEG